MFMTCGSGLYFAGLLLTDLLINLLRLSVSMYMHCFFMLVSSARIGFLNSAFRAEILNRTCWTSLSLSIHAHEILLMLSEFTMIFLMASKSPVFLTSSVNSLSVFTPLKAYLRCKTSGSKSSRTGVEVSTMS